MKDKEIKVFLLGSYKNNAGPDNVNRCLIKNSIHDLLHIEQTGRVMKRIEIFCKIISSDIVVFSGFGKNKFWLSLCKFLRRKTIYLMHGCATYETKINKLDVKQRILDFEKEFLESVDLVLPVSEQYKNWVIQQFPSIEKKIHFLNSGISGGGQSYAIDNRNHKENDEKICIIVAGGDRIQKNNIEVCKAVELLSERINKKIELQICGRRYYDNDIFSKYPHTTYLGMLPNEQFMEKLSNAHVFVLNSEVESFGLSAVDALRAGCNILISQNSGIRSILSLTEEDIIFDTHNPSEIADKIEKLISKNNCMRILDSINFEHYSWKSVADRLYKICEAVYDGKDYNLIR